MEYILALILIGFGGMTMAKMLRIVPQQTACVVERLGRYHATLEPGLHIIVPFVDRIAYIHLLKEVPYDVQPQVCITKDNTQVQIDGILYFQVTDPKLASYGTSDFRTAIENLAKTTLRSEVGKRDLDKLLEDRQTINVAVVNALDEASSGWGVKVLRYEVKDIVPPAPVINAMQLQITAEREKRAKIAESEGERQKAINIAEGQKQAAIAKSEGDKAAAINNAQGQAQAILAIADATAQALAITGKAISEPGGQEAVNLKVAQQYLESFGNIAKTSNTVVVPANLSDPASFIAGALKVAQSVGKTQP